VLLSAGVGLGMGAAMIIVFLVGRRARPVPAGVAQA